MGDDAGGSDLMGLKFERLFFFWPWDVERQPWNGYQKYHITC